MMSKDDRRVHSAATVRRLSRELWQAARELGDEPNLEWTHPVLVDRVLAASPHGLEFAYEYLQGRDAIGALDLLDGKRLAQDIEDTCERLGLTNDTRNDGLDLNRLRNQSLAHPGKNLTRERLAVSRSKARDACCRFLHGYIRWRTTVT